MAWPSGATKRSASEDLSYAINREGQWRPGEMHSQNQVESSDREAWLPTDVWLEKDAVWLFRDEPAESTIEG
jgi:hypothetical protein